MHDVGARAGAVVARRRLSQTELAVITRQLASLLGAQLPVADALTVMVEQSEKQQRARADGVDPHRRARRARRCRRRWCAIRASFRTSIAR